MDEILSSIRQIIADDDGREESDGSAEQTPDVAAFAADTQGEAETGEPDAADAPEAATPPADAGEDPGAVPEEVDTALDGINFDPEAELWPDRKPSEAPEADVAPAAADPVPEIEQDDEPLALSAEQIVEEEAAEPEPDPVPEPADEPELDVSALLADEEAAVDLEEASEEIAAHLVEADDIDFTAAGNTSDEPDETDEPAPATASPLPDPDLSADMAEQLLDTTSEAAVSHAFAKLGNLALGNSGITIETMIREMLRPMLKEWLDENLPSMVERMVEREIERISRGGR